MPIYEYTCPACGTRFEAIKKLGEDSAPCPRCGGTAGKVAASTVSVKVDRPAGRRHNESCDRSNPCCGRAEPCGDRNCH
jgi:putative FmdB family regulatory protein